MVDIFAAGKPPVLTSVDAEIECDIVIIGSGMGGATLAYGLRDTGARVLVVEQGDFLPRELQNWSPTAVHMQGRYKNSAAWFDQAGNSFIPGNYHYVGGSTKLYGATLPRFREFDFGDVEHPDGISPAWPITYDDLEPFYGEAEKMYWVHGKKGEDPTDPWRSTDFPLPPIPYEPTIAELAERLKRQGLKPYALPQALDLQPGGKCLRCATCDAFPCMVDAKGDADVSAMRPALRSPNVKLLTRAEVLRLETDGSGRRVMQAVVRRDGDAVSVRAGRFVVAAGAVNTAVLLLRSRSEAHPAGLANSSDQVGRNYMTHTTSFFLAVDPRRKNQDVYQKTIGLNDWYAPGADNKYPLGNVQGLGKLQGAMVKSARKLIPLPILDAVAHRTVDLFIQTEDLPLPDNRITLDGSGRVVVARKATNVSSHMQLIGNMKRAVRKAGYPVVLQQQLGVEATSHQCGTAKMGVEARDSVVGADCKAHDLDNMWIVDTSVGPSSAAVKPPITAAALALRVAASRDLTS
jgi:choline dehydrogenase-like flavoprotein